MFEESSLPTLQESSHTDTDPVLPRLEHSLCREGARQRLGEEVVRSEPHLCCNK